MRRGQLPLDRNRPFLDVDMRCVCEKSVQARPRQKPNYLHWAAFSRRNGDNDINSHRLTLIT